MHYTRRRILLVSLLLEGTLSSVYLIWAWLRRPPLAVPTEGGSGWLGELAAWGEWLFALPEPHHLVYGVLAALPLFAVNYLLFGPLSHRTRMLSSCFEFKDRIVKPLANELDARSALLVALCAGIGEELFFRGVLQPEGGLFVASAAFSLLHFGPAVKKYLFIAVLYVVIGAYFGALYLHSGTLWVPVTTHVVYDFAALLYMRYAYVSPPVPTHRRPVPPKVSSRGRSGNGVGTTVSGANGSSTSDAGAVSSSGGIMRSEGPSSEATSCGEDALDRSRLT